MNKQKAAEHHKMACSHYEKAAHCHKEAANHHAAGNSEKAAYEAHMAHGHTCCAMEHASEASKCCVTHDECKK